MRSLSRSVGVGSGVTVVTLAVAAAVALAAGVTLGVGRARVSGKTRTVVVDSRGATLYTLGGETARHLKCVSRACFAAWPPYQVSARARLTKARGVVGRLSKLHRVKARFYQVMLNGRPLYRFYLDKGRKGSALGEGIRAFGGVWHVVFAR